VPPAWRIAAAADFNGDLKPDLVWQNTTTGERSIWLMNGTNVGSYAPLPTVPTQWSIAGVLVTLATGSTISGSVDGTTPWNRVASTFWIGKPDNPSTTVVYLFSKPVVCSDLVALGWDTRIPNDTQVLQLKMIGTGPATYRVTTSPTPAPGDAVAIHMFSRQSSASIAQSASGGTATLSAVASGTKVTGSFAVNFGPSNSLNGTYDAAFCAGGMEP
jgi:hypothetical protein